MKFIETSNATFVNLDNISHINHEWDGNINHLFSLLYLKNGEIFDFLEVPNSFDDDTGKTHVFDSDHLISLHRHAIHLIGHYDLNVIPIKTLEQDAWQIFLAEFNAFIAKAG